MPRTALCRSAWARGHRAAAPVPARAVCAAGAQCQPGSVPAGANILSVIANGNVGINNASPVSALDVGGTVTSTGLKVNGDAQVTGVLSGSGASLVNLNAANISSGVLASDRFSGTY